MALRHNTAGPFVCWWITEEETAMKKLPALVFGLGLALLPPCANAQNTPSTPPLNGTPTTGTNELPPSGGVGTDVVNATGWNRYLPQTPTGWGALLLTGSLGASFVWKRLHEER
jgi:hypothetical protein